MLTSPQMNETAGNKTILTAAWVAPISSPMLADGAVCYQNHRILAVRYDRRAEGTNS